MWRLTFPVLGAILFGAHLYFLGKLSSFSHPFILLILLFIPFQTGLLALGDLPDLFRC